jgi:hypothetical protein
MIISPRTRPFAVGDAVLLRGSAFGVPGRVVRLGKRLSVLWPDLDFIERHSPGSLILANEHSIPNPTGHSNSAVHAGPRMTVHPMSVNDGSR